MNYVYFTATLDAAVLGHRVGLPGEGRAPSLRRRADGRVPR